MENLYYSKLFFISTRKICTHLGHVIVTDVAKLWQEWWANEIVPAILYIGERSL
jgi:hypothetical protein